MGRRWRISVMYYTIILYVACNGGGRVGSGVRRKEEGRECGRCVS